MSVIVIGAGIVGLSVAYEALQSGAAVTIIDRDPEGDKASFGNAGGIAVTEVIPLSVPGLWKKVPFWVLDPLGPLAIRVRHAPHLLPWLWGFAKVGTPSEVRRISGALASINSHVYDDLVPLFNKVGLANDLYRNGALTVYESESGLRRDQPEWDAKRSLGIEAQELSGSQVRGMEPALGPIVKNGVFMPQWSHVSDPKKVVDVLRNWLAANGVQIMRGQVDRVDPTTDGAEITLNGGRTLSAAKIVIAAGAWSAQLANRLGDHVLLESERGYNTTIPSPGISLEREVIFADRKLVATPLSIGLRIGGAAEFGGLKAAPNFKRSKALTTLAKLYLPGIKEEGGVEWSGHRPATPDSLPVIGLSGPSRHILYAFGHGHLGLTLGPTTGKIVGDLLLGRQPCLDAAPFSVARFSQKGRRL
ncbi:FAD-binding oxidoreductase [Mesorhizobium sp. WSM4307]|uniref:NAD(P)/FAD-dependent oxidoreductase n=1 Tax=unclassified Mesorhizobium TaxID=325217 RepID=UPI00115DB6B7|nr:MULTISPECIES: FAD-binding oxidoreductase [unclassified Mesorhizobium]TRC73084.1 FAD-binding oxidoreductase [Mesorhizobium sp. WSM4315]TRC83371.1 FAD-binding oxidoreductase [Mesorhizobium sp. WSM4307]